MLAAHSNLFEVPFFTRMLCVHFVRRRFWAISTESQRSRPNRRCTRCTEHVSQKIRPSKRLELYMFHTADFLSEEENPSIPKKSTQNKKFHLHKFSEEFSSVSLLVSQRFSKSSRERFEKVRVNAVFFRCSGKTCFRNRALVEAIFEASKCL